MCEEKRWAIHGSRGEAPHNIEMSVVRGMINCFTYIPWWCPDTGTIFRWYERTRAQSGYFKNCTRRAFNFQSYFAVAEEEQEERQVQEEAGIQQATRSWQKRKLSTYVYVRAFVLRISFDSVVGRDWAGWMPLPHDKKKERCFFTNSKHRFHCFYVPFVLFFLGMECLWVINVEAHAANCRMRNMILLCKRFETRCHCNILCSSLFLSIGPLLRVWMLTNVMHSYSP